MSRVQPKVQFSSLVNTCSQMLSIGFLEETSLKPGSKLMETYGRTVEIWLELKITEAVIEKIRQPSLVVIIRGMFTQIVE